MQNFQLYLKGKTLVLIDWANVYAQQRKLDWKVDIKKVYDYFSNFDEIGEIMFFHGTDPKNQKSSDFLEISKHIGYTVITKKVKYFEKGKRKCDLDMEIGTKILMNLGNYDHFILFSGDGDFACVIEEVLKKGKYFTTISLPFYLGREIAIIKQRENIQKKDLNKHQLRLIHLKKLESDFKR